jgi:uncharacterized surface protein with fasciclin (FAS1) repeats
MKNIIDTAMGNTDLSTLVTAIKAAGLVDTLSGTGPFTVFAPNNAAFAKLDPETLKGLLEDKDKLSAILTYHVLAGKEMSADIAKLTEATTLNGVSITIDTTSGVKINTAQVLTADVECENGVVHVIDTVLMPA